MKSNNKKIKSHLNKDIKGYKKEIKYLKKEVREDEELKKGLKNGTKKKLCCKGCEKGHPCEGDQSVAGKRSPNAKKTGRQQRRRV